MGVRQREGFGHEENFCLGICGTEIVPRDARFTGGDKGRFTCRRGQIRQQVRKIIPRIHPVLFAGDGQTVPLQPELEKPPVGVIN